MRLLCSAVGLSFMTTLFALPLCASKSPSIIVNGDGPDPTSVTTNTFGFGADAMGGGDFVFTNDSGNDWTRLDITFTLPVLEAIFCSTNVYATCTQTTQSTPNGVLYDLILSGQIISTDAITNGESFTINLNNNGSTAPDGAGNWPPGADFTAVANVPEPSPALLAGLGLLLFGAGRFLIRRFRAKAFF